MASMEKFPRGPWERMQRLSRLKLLIPLKRSPHSPEYSARSVAVGMFWAMTPLVGVQMYLCLMTWLVCRPFRKLRHSLVISCAWTWVTNVFTMLPVYYGFYATGQVMTGHWDDITGYGAFHNAWQASFAASNTFWEGVAELVVLLAKDLGCAMLIGCLPYAIGGAWVSYYLSLKYVRRRRRRMAEKRAREANARDHDGDTRSARIF